MQGKPSTQKSFTAEDSLSSHPEGSWVERDGETYFQISSFQGMAPFFMSLPSDTDLWMFVTSRGGLTAGRVDANGSLFPYETVDRLHDAHHHTGPLTLIKVMKQSGETEFWKPFSTVNDENPRIERNLFKNTVGNRLIFQEINHELHLEFSYRWSSCDEYGWVRTASLENRNTHFVPVSVLDGLRNVLSPGAPLSLYQQSSNLVDAYKRCDVDPETGLGIFSMTAGITDRAEALESLRANVVYCCGLEGYRIHLTGDTVAAFLNGRVLPSQYLAKGQRGNYLVSSQLDLAPGHTSRWHLVADVSLDHGQISTLRKGLRTQFNLVADIDKNLDQSRDALRALVASSDGLQMTGRPEAWNHHFANTLFNCMRGGIFLQNYNFPVEDFVDFLKVRNLDLANKYSDRLSSFEGTMALHELLDLALQEGNPGFIRLCHEYLPLHFGRRHGDPSRPWNKFSIQVRDQSGEQALNYEGNWRDIFQNWEALGLSFPGYYANFIAKFVNASTVDGFNPYRINKNGLEWEEITPEDPWSNIGYWGDHQIIYLLKLLEALHQHDPQALGQMLNQEIFSFAEVPYRLKPYEELLRNPSDTITYDEELSQRIEDRVAQLGSDGKLLEGPDHQVYHTNLLEKLLIPTLSKLANLVPGAGIWMNTQRPEWNDANNALAGGGISVVTLCYLRRYLVFLTNLLNDVLTDQVDLSLPVSAEVATWFKATANIFALERDLLSQQTLSDTDSKRLLDALGEAFSEYRSTVYAHGFSGKTEISVAQAVEFCQLALEFVDQGIQANRREDDLYHTYNLLSVGDDLTEMEVTRLPEMLEGQVAVLSSGILKPDESLLILERLFDSALFREDQNSFMLYPERELPGFLDKNVVPAGKVESIGLLQHLLASANSDLVIRDEDGLYRFLSDFQKEDDLAAQLDALQNDENLSEMVRRDRTQILDLFEEVFHHDSYTGRSGYMYGYEGLGCIYWHMVAKLLLAVQEIILSHEESSAPEQVIEKLKLMYFRVRAGLGYERSVSSYGAFPTDPYSHTPASGGAKQPGMTGQVKEELLTRLGELGVRINGGLIRFDPVLLQKSELSPHPMVFEYHDINGDARRLELPPGTLAFTLCQVPVVYESVSGNPGVRIEFANGSSEEVAGHALTENLSRDIFDRSGRVSSLRVGVPDRKLR